MKKTFPALALATLVALSGLSPSPARADNDNLRKFVLGAGALALTAMAVRHYREQKQDDARQRQRSASQTVPVRRQNGWPAPAGQTPSARVDPRDPPRIVVDESWNSTASSAWGANRYPGHIETRHSLPKSCVETFPTGAGNRSVLQETCLQRAGIRPAELPHDCRRIVDLPGRQRDRAGYSRACLAQAGYRIE